MKPPLQKRKSQNDHMLR